MTDASSKTRTWAVIRYMLLVACAFAAGCLSRPYFGGLLDRNPVPIGSPTSRPEGEGWLDLLSTDNAPDWKNVGDDHDIFVIEDGMLHVYGRTVYPLRYVTYTGQTFSDFDLHLEYKVARGANSGVFLRTDPNDAVNRGFEVQVLDDYGKPPTKNGAGAIYDVVTPMYNLSRPAGEWNSFDISVVGKNVSVNMNGWKVIDTDFSKLTTPVGKFPIAYNDLPLEGNIALQDHGGEVWYRNVVIRPR
ncbi:MAG: DUF1080 domain-containing protein [Candidatus Hydrogenedentes bacterium]|nr:DUF1080 domain-containing protein [Candidatus Hydrogenedentota bacterium]